MMVFLSSTLTIEEREKKKQSASPPPLHRHRSREREREKTRRVLLWLSIIIIQFNSILKILLFFASSAFSFPLFFEGQH